MKKILLLLSIVLCMSLAACGGPKTTNSAEGYIGENYEVVVSELKDAGFTNIETKEVQDLTSLSELQDGDVGEISINGETSFGEGTAFEAEVPIVITYHTIPKLEAPIASEEIQAYGSNTLAEMFKEAGFENVKVEDVYDLDPDEVDVEYINEINVGYISSFDKGEGLPFDAEVTVTCHRAYEKYDVKLIIDFKSNLLFDRHDVTMEFNGEEHVMPHGEGAEFTYRLKEGMYTLSFVSDEDSPVVGEVELDVHCEVEASYKIACTVDEIKVETIYIDNKEELAEDEVKVMAAESDLKYGQYDRVVNKLKDWGFTNISEDASYDYGFLIPYEDGEVIEVTINGDNSYKKGDIFKKDAKVVVKYYASLFVDPGELEVLTVDNCPELAAMLSNKAEYDDTYVDFAEKYESRVIEFDGRVDYITKFEDNDYRYEMLVSAGDYDPDHQIGPTFKFIDVMADDFGLSNTKSLSQQLPVGSNIHIKAKVRSFNSNSYLFFLDPVSVELR